MGRDPVGYARKPNIIKNGAFLNVNGPKIAASNVVVGAFYERKLKFKQASPIRFSGGGLRQTSGCRPVEQAAEG